MRYLASGTPLEVGGVRLKGPIEGLYDGLTVSRITVAAHKNIQPCIALLRPGVNRDVRLGKHYHAGVSVTVTEVVPPLGHDRSPSMDCRTLQCVSGTVHVPKWH